MPEFHTPAYFNDLNSLRHTEAEVMYIWEPNINPPAYRVLKSTDFVKAPHEIGHQLFSRQFSLTSTGGAQFIYQAPANNRFAITHLSFSVKNLGVSGSDIWFIQGTDLESPSILHAQHYVASDWQNVTITYSVPWITTETSNGSNNNAGLHFVADNNSSVFGVVHGYDIPV